MNKHFILSFFGLIFAGLFTFTGTVFAADTLSLLVNQPKSSTNVRGFNLSFVAMDIQSRGISVACSMKAPGDGGFSSVGSVVALPSGGGSGYCVIPDSRVNTAGNYEYRVTSSAGGDSVTKTVVVVYNNNNPSTPSDYRKEELNDCDYRISFRTGDGTDRVEIYRSENTSFSADSGTRVAGMNIGSNQNGQITNSVPNCQKNYYFALRAYNFAGNASDIVGDREVQTVVINPTTTVTHPAISVSGSGSGRGSGSGSTSKVLGEDTENTAGEQISGAPLPTSSAPESEVASSSGFSQIIRSPLTWLIGAGLLGLIILFPRRKSE